MSKKLLQQALDALEGVLDDDQDVRKASFSGGVYEVVQCRDAIAALRAAIAQPAEVDQFGWRIPTIMTFKDVVKWPNGDLHTSCPPAHRDAIGGTVVYGLEMFCDDPDEFVTDKHGVKHFPTPLYVGQQECIAQPVQPAKTENKT